MQSGNVIIEPNLGYLGHQSNVHVSGVVGTEEPLEKLRRGFGYGDDAKNVTIMLDEQRSCQILFSGAQYSIPYRNK